MVTQNTTQLKEEYIITKMTDSKLEHNYQEAKKLRMHYGAVKAESLYYKMLRQCEKLKKEMISRGISTED